MPESARSCLVAVSADQQVAPMQVSVLKLACFFSNCQAQSGLQDKQLVDLEHSRLVGSDFCCHSSSCKTGAT